MAVTLQQIFCEHFDDFATRHPLAPYQRDAAHHIRVCRTAVLGGHWVGCPQGHVAHKHYNSCRHRSCPQCAAMERERWLAEWSERLLECPHHHVIFTLPHDLIPLWRYNKREFPNVLFRAAIDSLRKLLDDPQYLGATPGLLAGLHTWGQTLIEHPHLHVIVSAGGLTEAGQWVEPKKSCLLPRRVLMEVFRGKMCAYLRQAVEKGDLTLPADTTVERVQSLLNRLGRVDWNVKILDRYEHGRGVLKYLARYLKGGPISNARILDCRDGRVRIGYRDHGDVDESEGRGKRKTVNLDVDTFLARVLEHVPPPGFQAVRPYGLYANPCQDQLAVARAHFGQASLPKRRRRMPWQEVCRRLGREDATVCPTCGAPLERLGRIPPSRGPPTSSSPPVPASVPDSEPEREAA